MTTSTSPFQRVCHYASLWKVPIHLRVKSVPTHLETDKNWYIGSWQTSYIHWTKKIREIFWWDKENALMACTLLHELSHVLQRINPLDIDETESGMLAFEFYSSKFLGLTNWNRFMTSYRIAHPPQGILVEWRDLSRAWRAHYIHESLKSAVRSKILTKDGKPTFRCKYLPKP